jgi:hypothetical protein
VRATGGTAFDWSVTEHSDTAILTPNAWVYLARVDAQWWVVEAGISDGGAPWPELVAGYECLGRAHLPPVALGDCEHGSTAEPAAGTQERLGLVAAVHGQYVDPASEVSRTSCW